jgi:hypothetical protein
MAFRVLVAVLGIGLILLALRSAIRTFVVPRGTAPDVLTRAAFVTMRYVFELPLRRASILGRERALAYYAPVTLLTLPVMWLGCMLLGYAGIYWALSGSSWDTGITDSRLSLLYLGANVSGVPGGTAIAFSETVLSLLLAAILVSYLPAIYSAFSQREQAVTGLETRAGTPPTPVKMLKRYHLIQGMEEISEVWTIWESWFEMVEESHTALVPLVLYRSPQPKRSWITAAGAVLDTASIVASTVERPRDPHAELCIRAGYLCLRRVAAPFGIPFIEDPAATDPISVSRQEYDRVYEELAALGIPLRADRDQAWRDFAGWRVNYDAPLVGLAVLTAAPPGLWSSDRISQSRSLFVTARRSARRAAGLALSGGLPALVER